VNALVRRAIDKQESGAGCGGLMGGERFQAHAQWSSLYTAARAQGLVRRDSRAKLLIINQHHTGFFRARVRAELSARPSPAARRTSGIRPRIARRAGFGRRRLGHVFVYPKRGVQLIVSPILGDWVGFGMRVGRAEVTPLKRDYQPDCQRLQEIAIDSDWDRGANRRLGGREGRLERERAWNAG